ncbi:hypothetical protein CMV_026497 [Castanea mollissima]|uniref:glycerophosphodiester phosphodiesterase n=1 Tax=Castanea mollissima TaxID=60419 RepID=A0A8J4QB14_9ROSI|nr:hypothetical protein CMV_026497 [Castanea mollissima]
MTKAAFITMKNWRDCGSCPSMLVSVYLWASWFDRGVALRGFLPFTSKSLILPPDIDTLDLVESKEFSLKLIMFTPPGFWLNIQNDQFFAQHNLSMRSFILSVSKNFLGQDETEPSTNQTYGHEEELEDFANDVPLSVSYSYDPVTQFLNYIDNGNFSVNGVLADVPLILHQRL